MATSLLLHYRSRVDDGHSSYGGHASTVVGVAMDV